MSLPPTVHQLISGETLRQLANFLEGKKCRAIPAPFAVRLFEKENDAPSDVQTVVEPDITVVCDRSKLDEHMAMDMDSSDIHRTSSWPSTDESDYFK